MKKITLIGAVLSLAALNQGHADVIALKANIDYWQYNADMNHPQQIPTNSELDDDHSLAFSAAFEHPIPFLPNAKIKHTNLKADSQESSDDVHRNQLDLDYTDFILYYEILDNLVNLDAGFGLKRLDGNIRKNYMAVQDLSGNLPMFYAQGGVKLPFTGLSANAEVSVAALSDDRITDAQIDLKYNFVETALVDIGAKAGYRILDMQIDRDAETETKFKFKGPYLGIDAHF